MPDLYYYHITDKETIPPKLLDLNGNILSHVVKYLSFDNIQLSYYQENEKRKVAKIHDNWVRLVFNQKDLQESVDSLYEMANSIVISDFQVAVLIVESILRTEDMQSIQIFLQEQNIKDKVKFEQTTLLADDTQSLEYTVDLAKFNLYILPSNCPNLESDLPSLEANHLHVYLSDIQVLPAKPCTTIIASGC